MQRGVYGILRRLLLAKKGGQLDAREAHDVVAHRVGEVGGRCRYKHDICRKPGEHGIVLGTEEMHQVDRSAALSRDGSQEFNRYFVGVVRAGLGAGAVIRIELAQPMIW